MCCFIIVLFFSVYLLPDEGVGVGILGVTLGNVGAETKNPPFKIVLSNKNCNWIAVDI